MVNVRDRVSGESHRLQQGQAALAKAHRDAHRRFVQEARANARFDSMQARAAAGRGDAGTSSGPPLPPADNTKAPATTQAAPYVWSRALGLGRAGGWAHVCCCRWWVLLAADCLSEAPWLASSSDEDEANGAEKHVAKDYGWLYEGDATAEPPQARCAGTVGEQVSQSPPNSSLLCVCPV